MVLCSAHRTRDLPEVAAAVASRERAAKQRTLEGSAEASGAEQQAWRLCGARAEQPIYVLGARPGRRRRSRLVPRRERPAKISRMTDSMATTTRISSRTLHQDGEDGEEVRQDATRPRPRSGLPAPGPGGDSNETKHNAKGWPAWVRGATVVVRR